MQKFCWSLLCILAQSNMLYAQTEIEQTDERLSSEEKITSSLNSEASESPEQNQPPLADQPQPAQDEDLLNELQVAADKDAQTLKENKGAQAVQQENIENEDPLEQLPQGAKEVIGNETNPSISIILDFAGAYFSSQNRLNQGGHAPTQNGPHIQGAELAASAPIDPFFRLDMAFCLYHLHIEEIYLTTTALPLNLQLRAGQFKSNVGHHNPTHLHTWKFVLHPLPNEFLFGAESLHLPGVELSYLFPLPWYVELIGALQMGKSGSFHTQSEDDALFRDFVYPIRLVQFFDLHDDVALQFGLNSVLGTSPDAPEMNNRTYAFGSDIFFKWRPIGWAQTGYTYIAWVLEGWFRQTEVADDIWEDMGGFSDLLFGLDKRWELSFRYELWKRLSGDAYLPGQVAETEDEFERQLAEQPEAQTDPEQASILRAQISQEVASRYIDRDKYGLDLYRLSAAVSFLPSHFSRVRLQYSFENIDTFDHNHIVLLQLEVSAGAHGAHKY